jgi:hypothetical protein
MHDFAPYLPLIGLVLGLLCLMAGFGAGRRRRLVENLPTSKTTGVFIGLVELKGTAESARPLTSYLASQSCVCFQWHVDEHWSRTVTETYTDKDGKRQTRTRHESGWKRVADGGDIIPFLLKDDCGAVLVQPQGAKIEPLTMFEETCRRSDPLYYAKGPAHAVSDSDHRRRFVEEGIPLHAALYVMGQARERQDVVAPEIAADENAPLFLISTRTEEQVSSGMKWGERGWAFFGLLLTVGFFLWMDVQRGSKAGIHVTQLLLVVAGYLLLWAGAWVWMVFNSLVDLRQRVRQAWSLVDIQLKRRHDLIPNLVEVVKGYRSHEQETHTVLAALRTELAATPPGETGADYHAVSQTVRALSERYPELKASEAFLALQRTLAETEQRIALARGYFNNIATHYNTRLEIVPERYVASLVSMKPQVLMAANDFERQPVGVNLS